MQPKRKINSKKIYQVENEPSMKETDQDVALSASWFQRCGDGASSYL